MSHNAILEALNDKRFNLTDEKRLQQEIADVLDQNGLAFEREARLETGIIDFLCADGVGIEVKIKAPKRHIYRQCVRYCCDDKVRSLILVSATTVGLPARILEKPVTTMSLGSAWL